MGRGDEAAFDEAVVLHGASLRRVAEALVGPADAERFVVWAFLELLRQLDTADPEVPVETHLLRQLGAAVESTPVEVAPYDPCRFYPETHRWAGDWNEELEEPPPARWGPLGDEVRERGGEGSLRSRLDTTIEEALRHLPPDQRLCLALRDCLGWSLGDVATLLGAEVDDVGVTVAAGRWRVLHTIDAVLAREAG